MESLHYCFSQPPSNLLITGIEKNTITGTNTRVINNVRKGTISIWLMYFPKKKNKGDERINGKPHNHRHLPFFGWFHLKN